MSDERVNHPDHYNKGMIECIDAIESAVSGISGFEGFCIGNAIKYLWRWKHKGGIEDLKKAKWYIDKVIERSAYENLKESILSEKFNVAERSE